MKDTLSVHKATKLLSHPNGAVRELGRAEQELKAAKKARVLAERRIRTGEDRVRFLDRLATDGELFDGVPILVDGRETAYGIRYRIEGIGHYRIADVWPVCTESGAYGCSINEYFVGPSMEHRWSGGSIIGNQWDESQTVDVALRMGKLWVAKGEIS